LCHKRKRRRKGRGGEEGFLGVKRKGRRVLVRGGEG
jgi:hypothetical protein